jgi:hypothetical protein
VQQVLLELEPTALLTMIPELMRPVDIEELPSVLLSAVLRPVSALTVTSLVSFELLD